MRDPILLSWSGGKDSSLALAALRADPHYEVVGLLTTISSADERVGMHDVPYSLIEAQADSIGLPLSAVRVDASPSNAAYESQMLAAFAEMRTRHPRLRYIAFGDLFLDDIRAYRETLVQRAAMDAVFPLWGWNTHALAEEFIATGFRARLVCVDTTQLGAEFVGRAFDRALLNDLPSSVDPCGERGEFHTFAFDGPIFTRPLAIEVGATNVVDPRFARCELSLVGDVSR
jgi:uncharacterized protein (TIGR00290 family)